MSQAADKYILDAEEVEELRRLLERQNLTYQELCQTVREYEPYDVHDEWLESVRRQTEQDILRLRSLVKPYRQSQALPPLPLAPDGELYGVAFAYDEDRDDRVLIAIETMLPRWQAVAVHERKGVLTVWSDEHLTDLLELEVAQDLWTVQQFVPSGERWMLI